MQGKCYYTLNMSSLFAQAPPISARCDGLMKRRPDKTMTMYDLPVILTAELPKDATGT